MKNNRINIFLPILIALAWFMTYLYGKSINNALNEELRYKNNEIKTWIDKHNRQTTEISTLELYSEDLKLMAIHFKNKYDIEKLKPGKVTSIAGETIHTTDTIKIETDSAYIVNGNPVYIINDSTQWHNFNIIASKDSTIINYTISNSFVSWHQNDSKWYQRDRIKFYSINLNPNTRTTDKIEYQAKSNRKYSLIYLIVGLTAGLLIK